MLDHLGLVSAMRSRLRALEQQGTLRVRLYVDGDQQQPLPEDVALCLFRVMQEALSNIQKHAEARMVEIDLRLRPDEVVLTVRDDGNAQYLR